MKLSTRIRVAAVATVALVGLALAGCSSSAPESGSEPEGPQSLQLSLNAPPANFQIGNWSGGDSTLFISVYDTLLQAEVDGSITPGLAESYEYSDDRLTLTFTLRSGSTFTDGTPVNAAAVAASLEASRVGSTTAGLLTSIASIDTPDETTVVLTLSEPDASIVPLLTGIAGGIGSPEVLTAESSQLTPVGSGPYVLDEAKTTVGSSYALTKNEDYWNADAYPYDTVTFTIIQDPTAVQNALQTGQLDYAGVPSADVVKQFDSSKFVSGNNRPGTVAALWLVDREGAIVPALGDVRVRQAINLALDRDGIAAALNPGTNTATNQVFNPNGEAFSEELLDTYAFNLDEAKALMAEAGYADGFEITMPSTVVSTTYESVLTQALGDIGISVTWETVPFQDFYAKVYGGNYGMFFMMNGLSSADAQDANAVLSTVFNPFQSTTPELEELLATANSSTEEEQGAAFRAVNEYLVDEAWFAPVSTIGGFYVHSNAVDYTPPFVFGQTVKPWSPAAGE